MTTSTTKSKRKKKPVPFDQLVAQMKGALILAIGEGTFTNTCFRWADILVRWGKENG